MWLGWRGMVRLGWYDWNGGGRCGWDGREGESAIEVAEDGEVGGKVEKG